MSNTAASPHRFSGAYDHFYDSYADADISSKMKVPKRIRVTGENDDEPSVNWARYNGYEEKLDMQVPERIVVAGGDQHVGLKGIPREVQLEQSIMPDPDPQLYRIQTPPRNITLDSYTYPAVDDPSPTEDRDSCSTPVSNPGMVSRNQMTFSHGNESVAPAVMTDLSPSEELQLLRRQVGRLNRRVMALELDSQQRANREMIMYTLGVAYFLIKAVIWLNRN